MNVNKNLLEVGAPNHLKDKLINLSDFLPGKDQIVYDFAAFLASNIVTTLTSDNFILYFNHGIDDLKKGYNGYNSSEIDGDISSYSQLEYNTLHSYFNEITSILFGNEISDRVTKTKKAIDVFIHTGSILKYKLSTIKSKLPGENDIVYEFADFLSIHACDNFTKERFIYHSNSTIMDLKNRIDNYTGLPIKKGELDYTLEEYEELSQSISRIADVIY